MTFSVWRLSASATEPFTRKEGAMHPVRLFAAVMVAALLSACGTISAKHSGVTMKSIPKATTPRQEGYLQLEVHNVKYDAKHPVLRGVADAYTTQEERLRRVREFPLQVVKGLQDGSIKAAGPHTYIVCLWGTDTSVPSASTGGWLQNGTKMSAISADDLVGRSNACDDNSLGGKPLGPPDRIFRVRAEGADARMVAVQVPWTMLTADTSIMVCSAEKPTMYPGGTKGLSVSPRYLNNTMRGKAASDAVEVKKPTAWRYAIFVIAHEQ